MFTRKVSYALSATFRLLPVVVAVVAMSQPGFAVVVDTGDGTANTTAPVDDPGFANVGVRGVATGIYLGNRWAMTADHVGQGSLQLGGVNYPYIPSETVHLSNPEGLSDQTDILLLRLQEDPGLPAIHLPCDPINAGDEVTLIGNGHDRQPDASYWDVDKNPGQSDDVWQPVD